MIDLQQELDKCLPSFIEAARKIIIAENRCFELLNTVLGDRHRDHCRTKARFGRYSDNCERCALLRSLKGQITYNRASWAGLYRW